MKDRGFKPEDLLAIGIGAGTGLMEFQKEKETGYFATCMISPLRHGYETTELLYKWIKEGAEPPKDTRTKGVMATRENYKQVLKDLDLTDVLNEIEKAK